MCMMCQRIGCSPIGTIGLGSSSVTSRSRVPLPPQRIIAGGMTEFSFIAGPPLFLVYVVGHGFTFDQLNQQAVDQIDAVAGDEIGFAADFGFELEELVFLKSVGQF